MLQLLSEKLERYVEAHSTAVSPLLNELAAHTRAAVPMAQMLAGPVEARLLAMLVRLTAAKHVLEIGTYTGYSALAMAEALSEGGTLLTCDINRDTTAIAQSFWERSPHGRKILLRLGPALETLASLQGEARFDLAFIDADKPNYRAYAEAILPRLRVGGLLVADNTLWSGEVVDPETEDARGIAAYNDFVVGHPQLEVVQLAIRDGVTLAMKLGR